MWALGACKQYSRAIPGWAALRGSAAQWGPAKPAEPARPTAQLAASPAAQPPEWAPEAEKPEGHYDHDAAPAPRLTGRLLGKSEPGAGSGSGASGPAPRAGATLGACTWGELLLASGPEGAGSMRGGGLAVLTLSPAGIKGALRARGAAAYLQIELQKQEAHTAAVKDPNPGHSTVTRPRSGVLWP